MGGARLLARVLAAFSVDRFIFLFLFLSCFPAFLLFLSLPSSSRCVLACWKLSENMDQGYVLFHIHSLQDLNDLFVLEDHLALYSL